MLALAIQNLQKRYKTGVEALKGIDLEIKVGDFFALLGPNGAGKSTTIGIICSLINKDSGTIKIFGYDIDTDFAKAKRNLGIVPQEFNFAIFETVWQTLVQQAGYYGITADVAGERAEKYLKLLELWEKRHARIMTLSGGMKRRLMMCRALLHEPPILILDEPTAGVDVEARHLIWDFLKQINQAGKTIILTTHYLEEAENMCNNVAIIDHGVIIENNSMRKVLSKLKQENYVLDLQHPIAQLPQLANVDINILEKDGACLEVSLPKNYDLCGLFAQLHAAGAVVNGIRNKTNRLEELFLQLTKHAKKG